MKKVLQIRNMKLGEGRPKICVPITGTNEAELAAEIEVLKTTNCDAVEWRVDFFSEIHRIDRVKKALHELRLRLGDLPLLFTCRTKEEGGEISLTKEAYLDLYAQVIQTGNVDLVDAQLFQGDDVCRKIVEMAHAHQVYVVMSSHDFQKTPDVSVLVERFQSMQELGADVPKIAVMPNSPADVLKLLEATYQFSACFAEGPVISMSMGWLGSISRISGEFFGSALTFGAASHASAPGQLAVSDVDSVLRMLHKDHE